MLMVPDKLKENENMNYTCSFFIEENDQIVNFCERDNMWSAGINSYLKVKLEGGFSITGIIDNHLKRDTVFDANYSQTVQIKKI